MSYAVKQDEMVGKYVAEFQAELTMTKSMEEFYAKPPMPYGYPLRLYHPHHRVRIPRATKMVHKEHKKLSNRVPWVLGMYMVGNYIVGAYNPKKDEPSET